MTTHYTVSDVAFGTTVFNVDTKERIDHVLSVDTHTGELEICCQPTRLHPADDSRVETCSLKFRAIHPIFSGGRLPCMFHCYGNIA